MKPLPGRILIANLHSTLSAEALSLLGNGEAIIVQDEKLLEQLQVAMIDPRLMKEFMETDEVLMMLQGLPSGDLESIKPQSLQKPELLQTLIEPLLIKNLMPALEDIRVDSSSEEKDTLFEPRRRGKKQKQAKVRAKKKLRYRKCHRS